MVSDKVMGKYKAIQDITREGKTNKQNMCNTLQIKYWQMFNPNYPEWQTDKQTNFDARHYKTRTYKQTQSTFKTIQNKDRQTDKIHSIQNMKVVEFHAVFI